MKTVKVLVIDPGKYPEYVDVEVTPDMHVYNDDRNIVIGTSAYKVAEKLLREYPESSDCYVERFMDRGLRGIGMYVDEEGRLKGITANRNIIFQNHQMMPIAGRLIVMPDREDFDNCEFVYNDDGWDWDMSQESMKKFIQTNWDDGTGPIVSLSQEDSNRIHHNIVEFSQEQFNDFVSFLEFLRRISGMGGEDERKSN